jgi:hypothetical protein
MGVVRFYDGGDMKLVIPVTNIDSDTQQFISNKPRTDFTRVDFHVLIGKDPEPVKKFTYPDAVEGYELAKAGSEAHIFELPVKAADHASKYGQVRILVLAHEDDATYGDDDYIAPVIVKGGEKCRL